MELVAEGVRINALEGLPPIDIEGKTRLQMLDTQFTMAGDGGVIQTPNGNISVANAALVMTSRHAGREHRRDLGRPDGRHSGDCRDRRAVSAG